MGGAYVLKMALKGLQVLELAGLAPVPFAGLILAGQWMGDPSHAILPSLNLYMHVPAT